MPGFRRTPLLHRCPGHRTVSQVRFRYEGSNRTAPSLDNRLLLRQLWRTSTCAAKLPHRGSDRYLESSVETSTWKTHLGLTSSPHTLYTTVYRFLVVFRLPAQVRLGYVDLSAGLTEGSNVFDIRDRLDDLQWERLLLEYSIETVSEAPAENMKAPRLIEICRPTAAHWSEYKRSL